MEIMRRLRIGRLSFREIRIVLCASGNIGNPQNRKIAIQENHNVCEDAMKLVLFWRAVAAIAQ
jgi:hypothetical protein